MKVCGGERDEAEPSPELLVESSCLSAAHRTEPEPTLLSQNSRWQHHQIYSDFPPSLMFFLSPTGSMLPLVTWAERDDSSDDKIRLSWIEKLSFKLTNIIICVIHGWVGLKNVFKKILRSDWFHWILPLCARLACFQALHQVLGSGCSRQLSLRASRSSQHVAQSLLEPLTQKENSWTVFRFYCIWFAKKKQLYSFSTACFIRAS